MRLRDRTRQFLVANRSFFVFFGLMLVFRSAFADWMDVPSGSMNPTIVEGDRLLVEKAAYGLRIPFTTIRLTPGEDPRRGEIVVFESPEDGMTLVKRVVGLPGDTVEMRDEQLFINGRAVELAAADVPDADAQLPSATQALDRRYLTERLDDRPHEVLLLPHRATARTFGPVQVPADHYLMLGDSRDNSKDSRYIGFVPRDNIFGRATRVAFSLDRERWYVPRTDRFFAKLR